MGKVISRRGFLKKGALALAIVVVGDVAGAGGAEQADGLKTLSAQERKERTMPHVIVKLYPGRSEEQKVQLAEAIVENVVAIAKCDAQSVSVAIEEIKPEEWAEKVYRPDILNAPGKLYKKPGYSM